MTIRELTEKSRSWRGYNEDRPVTREELIMLADCARLCPSSVNAQPLKYYLAWEADEVRELQVLTRWARGLPQMTLPHPGRCPTAYIVILQDTAVDPSLARYQKDVGIVAQTMLLAATEMGLGGCMIGNFTAAEVSRTLHLPETLVPMLLVAIGEPAEDVRLTEPGKDGSVAYYRDENDVHYVPKRALSDVVLTRDGGCRRQIYLAGGCYWGVEKYVSSIRGVLETEVGFANGHTDAPTYHQVRCEGTGHAETVRVVYDAAKLPLEALLRLFFEIIDPVSVDRQGEDVGHQYRTGIYYEANADGETAKRCLKELQKRYEKPLAVECEPLRGFWPAEEYHQKYLDKTPGGYCHVPLEKIAWVRGVEPEKFLLPPQISWFCVISLGFGP